MSCGHADKILAAVAGIPAAADSLPIDLALYRRDDVRRVLAERDITSLVTGQVMLGVQGCPSASMTRVSKRCRPCLAAVDR